MYGSCRCGIGDKCLPSMLENLGKDHMRNIGVDWRIILKRNVKVIGYEDID